MHLLKVVFTETCFFGSLSRQKHLNSSQLTPKKPFVAFLPVGSTQLKLNQNHFFFNVLVPSYPRKITLFEPIIYFKAIETQSRH